MSEEREDLVVKLQ
jgi:hypothetical protein